jgi:hypothetical protein
MRSATSTTLAAAGGRCFARRSRPGSSLGAQQRLAEILDPADFDEAMIAALRAGAVLGADESPVNVVGNIDHDGNPATGYLMWSRCVPRTSGWSGTRPSPPGPRPRSGTWVSSRAGTGRWSVTTTPATTSSTPPWGGCGNARLTSCATSKTWPSWPAPRRQAQIGDPVRDRGERARSGQHRTTAAANRLASR